MPDSTLPRTAIFEGEPARRRNEEALPPGSRHYRAFVGPLARYDLMAALQFSLLTALGLRDHHFLADIGCGSLRVGRLLIPYLLPERYFGIEPEQWLVEEGLRNELGEDIVAVKRPTFSAVPDFQLSSFGQTFDFLLAHSIFSHAAPNQIERCLSEARRAMHTESLFVATYISGGENYVGDTWTYPGCVSYRPEFVTSLRSTRSSGAENSTGRTLMANDGSSCGIPRDPRQSPRLLRRRGLMSWSASLQPVSTISESSRRTDTCASACFSGASSLVRSGRASGARGKPPDSSHV